MTIKDTNTAPPRDPQALALSALAWTLADESRARRFVDTTGLTPETLRVRLDEPATLAALLRFLEAHESDLIAAGEALGLSPTALVDARRELER